MAGSHWRPEEIETIRNRAADGWTDPQLSGILPGRSADAIRQFRKTQGITAGTVRKLYGLETPEPSPDFEVAPLPSSLPSADELRERRKAQFQRKDEAHWARRLIPVEIRLEGPVGIAHLGDAHLDDNGTDIGLVERHVEVIRRTKGLFAGNVGDFSNNWVGRLARLYGEQSTTAAEAWVLVEWYIRALPWLYLVGGNHDAWSGAGDPLKWIAQQRGALLEPHGARLGLHFPNGRVIRVNARHDFKGHSQWNTAHGPAKAAQMGWRDHVLTCGHLHTSGYQVVKDPATGLISHAIRTASYKTFDRYADEKGLPDQNIFVAPVTIVQPSFGDDEARCITAIFDPEEGASYLTWLRSRKTPDGSGPPAAALRVA